jgi:hypothetical protein
MLGLARRKEEASGENCVIKGIKISDIRQI